jgi:hypothetical protein
MKRSPACLLFAALLLACVLAKPMPAAADDDLPVIPNLPAAPTFSATTVPANGDLNPYGVAFVPPDFPAGGPLRPGDILVSNFNNSANLQGTGTTVVQITPNGQTLLFFQGKSGLGLTTALGVLKSGFVLVGNVPSTGGAGTCTPGPNGQEQGVEQGSLLILDRHGHLLTELTSAALLNGPWDLTIKDSGTQAQVFVSSVLSGTVTRLDLSILDDEAGVADRVVVEKATQIASGYLHRCDPAAFVVGPTGLALDAVNDILFVASTGDNAIFAITEATVRTDDAGMGRIVVRDRVHLHGPLALTRAGNGDLISSQGDAVNFDPNHPSEIVEFNSKGKFVAQFSIDPASGSAFGLALQSSTDGFQFAAVDDALNVLDVWVVK